MLLLTENDTKYILSPPTQKQWENAGSFIKHLLELRTRIPWTIDLYDNTILVCLFYEKKAWTLMINNSTNINKANNPSPQTIERKIDTWRWKSKSG